MRSSFRFSVAAILLAACEHDAAEPREAGEPGEATEAHGATDLREASEPGEATDPHEATEAHEAAAAEEHAPAAHDHGGHDDAASDLDQPLEELFARTCEHQKKTFECDECRYEVGVVEAPRTLFEEGLLTATRTSREHVARPLVLTGEVRFDERRVTHVSVPAQGMVRKVFVMLGDEAARGQPLVEVESIAVGEAEGDYLEARAALALTERNFERQTQLRNESISSEKDYLEARREHEAAQIRAEAALGKLTRLGLTAADARALTQASARGRLVLRAPVAGTVLAMHAVAGEVVRSEEPLATLGDSSVVWVWADVYERDLALLTRSRSGEPLAASVSVKAYPGEEHAATVDFVSPAMEESSRTVKVRAEVPNPDRRLLAGMFAKVKVFLPGDEEATTLPRSAVLEDEGRSFVFVHHHDDYYVRRPVTRGRAWADRVEIASGLSGGESVVADGAFLLKSDVLRSKMGAGCAD